MIRITGMNSGLDTESIITELASARSMKVENIKKDQTKLSWKIDAWKELNTKIYSFYTDVLSDMRFDYAYGKKTTKVSNPNAVSVVTGSDAVNGVQTMKINQLAKASYLTGGAIEKKAYALSGSSITGVPNHVTGDGVVASTALTGGSIINKNSVEIADDKSATTLSQLGLVEAGKEIKLSLTIDGRKDEITLNGSDSLQEVIDKFAEKNLSADFVVDTTNNKAGHFVINSMNDSTNNKYSAEFAISAISKTEGVSDSDVADSAALLKGLGLDAKTEVTKVSSTGTTLAELGITGTTSFMLKIGDNAAGRIDFENTVTLASVAQAFRDKGLNAEFDIAKGRFVINATDAADAPKTFAISALSAATDADDAAKTAARNSALLLGKLGLDTKTQEKATGKTTLATLGFTSSISLNVKAGISVNSDGSPSGGTGTDSTLTFDANDTLDDVAAKFQAAGVNAQFDATAGKFVFSAKDTKTTFAVSATDSNGDSSRLLAKLGLNYETDKGPSQGTIKDGTTKLSELGFGSDDKEIKFKLTIGGKAEEVTLKGSQTLDDVAAMLKTKGLNAKFDAATKRFFISAKESGVANGFEITAETITGYNADKTPIWGNNAESAKVLQDLGWNYTYYEGGDSVAAGQATMVRAQDAEVELNGAQFTFAKNTFEVNGLTITAMQETKAGESITLTTQQDTDGIYNMIKNFITKYNELINEMDKLYNAKSASKYKPLSSEEKDAMSDTEVEEWEKKIKESLLRRDGTLSSVASAMKNAMLSTGISDKNGVNEGKDIFLTFFGIETLGYFKAKDNEKNAYHINGDADDTSVKNNEDKLRKAIVSNTDTVVDFFKKLATNLYSELDEKMARTDYSSSFTVYNDKQMDKELKEYESKVKTEQNKLNDYIDKWYNKFSQMEVALSKLNSQQSTVSGLFG